MPLRQKRVTAGKALVFAECHHTLKVAGLGEKVEGLHVGELIVRRGEVHEVAHLGGGVAAHVDDCLRSELEELMEELFVTTFARRVDDDNGFLGREFEAGEDGGGVAGLEGGVGDVVCRGIFGREANGGFTDLDARDLFEGRGGRQREQAAATVGVDEKTSSAGGDLLANVVREGGQDEGVILEEVAGEEMELQIADGFGDDGFMVGGDFAGSIAE